MNIKKESTTILLWTSVVLTLAGCAVSNGHGVLPNNGPTMQNIYEHQVGTSSDSGTLDCVRHNLSRVHRVRKDAESESEQRGDGSPGMLPNPMIKIYVYPHFDGGDQEYVPGHTAYTKLYKETHFALPGETTE